MQVHVHSALVRRVSLNGHCISEELAICETSWAAVSFSLTFLSLHCATCEHWAGSARRLLPEERVPAMRPAVGMRFAREVLKHVPNAARATEASSRRRAYSLCRSRLLIRFIPSSRAHAWCPKVRIYASTDWAVARNWGSFKSRDDILSDPRRTASYGSLNPPGPLVCRGHNA